ncbi:fructose-6-phosphate aldolase [bacterium]|nr:fructose-6-phosphate aldolase [bacterium]
MKFFIDTADSAAITKAMDMGLVDGVTTNPTLILKSGRDHESAIREISALSPGPISVETLSEDADGMIREAETYLKWGTEIVIKVVMTPEGLKAVRYLSQRGIQTNVTLVFTPLQALMAAKAGATYVSPFVGRLDDIGSDGMVVIEQIRTIFDQYAFPTHVLVASVRNPVHLLNAALLGADVATVPPDTLMQLCRHPLTDAGVTKFLADAAAWKVTS